MNSRHLVFVLFLFAPYSIQAWWEKKLIFALGLGLNSGIVLAIGAEKAYEKYRQLQAKKNYRPVTKIGILRLRGDIGNPEEMLKVIQKYAKDSSLKAVLLVIDSGGGRPGASELLFREILVLSKVKPVVTLINNMCCSAAYKVAVGGDWIIAPSAACVGNIGDIEIFTRYDESEIEETHSKHKVHYEFLKAGKYKGVSFPHRGNLTEEEMNYLQNELEKSRTIFTEIIAQRRNLSLDSAVDWNEGQSFTGREARERGLIDQEGGLTDALEKTKQLICQRGGVVEGELVFVE